MEAGDYYLEHLSDKINRNLVAWFSLKNATLPYNDKESSFLIPAIELTHFAVDARYKEIGSASLKTGEFIFWNHIVPCVKNAQKYLALQDLFVFSINTPKLISYYKNRLGFQEIENIDDKLFFEYAVPDYELKLNKNGSKQNRKWLERLHGIETKVM